MNDQLKILIITGRPNGVGGVSTWSKNYLMWLKNHNYKYKFINNSRFIKTDNKDKKRSNFKRTISICKELRKKF